MHHQLAIWQLRFVKNTDWTGVPELKGDGDSKCESISDGQWRSPRKFLYSPLPLYAAPLPWMPARPWKE